MAIQRSFGNLTKGLQELILQVLTQQFPQRIKGIHQQLKEQYQVGVSFQAVRKALNQMIEQGKLEVENGEFRISKEYIKDAKQLSDALIKRYFTGERKDQPPQVNTISQEMQVFQLENSLQADKFLGELLLDIAAQHGKKILTIQALHFWYFLGHLGTESDFLQAIQRENTELYYVSFGGNTLLDKMAKRFYQQHGVKYAVVIEKLDERQEIIAINDYVIRVTYSPVFIKELEKIYKETKRIENLDYQTLGNLIKKKQKIMLTIFKDKTIATSIRENGLKNFN